MQERLSEVLSLKAAWVLGGRRIEGPLDEVTRQSLSFVLIRAHTLTFYLHIHLSVEQFSLRTSAHSFIVSISL